MKEWQGNELEKIDQNTMSQNILDNALVVISNMIARASTKWTLEETKLFLCSVSRIKARDQQNFVKLSKKDIADKLSIDTTKSKLREKFKRVAMKSYIEIDGNLEEEEWEDGFIINRIRSDKKNIYVQFTDYYIPLLDELSSHFTEFYLDHVVNFKHIPSYKLYVYLCSWYDNKYLIQNKKIRKNELYKVFGLNKKDYWRDYGKDNAKFHFADFEKKVLNPAIAEINKLTFEGKCDMFIESCEKVKDGKYVLGYDIKYSFLAKDLTRK